MMQIDWMLALLTIVIAGSYIAVGMAPREGPSMAKCNTSG
jgi:hypothetical protein